MLGNGCARPPFPSAINGFTPRTNRSCFRASPATSSCGRRRTFSNSAYSSVARCRLPKCDARTGHRSPRSSTSFTSSTATRSRLRLLTGFRKRMNCRTCWCRRQSRFAPNRSTSRSPADPLDDSRSIVAWRNERPRIAVSRQKFNAGPDPNTAASCLAAVSEQLT